MYNGSHARAKKHSRIRMNKLAILFIAVVMLIGAVVGSTVAFLVTDTQPVTNTFTYASVSCAVKETFNGATKENVQIQNTGTTDAYIRATYVVNWLNKEDGTIAASVPTDYTYTLEENPKNVWTKGNDGYFYYWMPVAPGNSTPESLLTCTVTYPQGVTDPQYILSVEILATAVQSTPANAVYEAWGVNPPTSN